MSSKYIDTLIKIANHVSTCRIRFNTNSCILVSENFKNLSSNTCYLIDCKNCAFNNSNHKKIDYLIIEGNSDA